MLMCAMPKMLPHTTASRHGEIIVEYIENYYAARDAVKPMDFSRSIK
jgi:hypothetical protein